MEKENLSAHYDYLLELSRKYLWWESPDRAVSRPKRVLAAAMNLGSIEDYQKIYRLFHHNYLAEVLAGAAPGWFSARSWSFWHRVLDLVGTSETVPPPPVRRFS